MDFVTYNKVMDNLDKRNRMDEEYLKAWNKQ